MDASKLKAAPVDLSALDALAEALKACGGLEQPAFEAWAAGYGFDMHEHPLHYLFLDKRTDAARSGWNAALAYARKAASTLPAIKAEIEALRGENEKMRGALREVRGDLLAGFIVCEHCGHQDTTSDMDVMLTLNAALGATS